MKRSALSSLATPLFAIALVLSCSDDDDPPPNNPAGSAGSSQAGQAGGGPAGAGGQAGGVSGVGGGGGQGGFTPDSNTFRPEQRPFSEALMQGLTVKPGFTISVFARGLGNARMMAVTAEGEVYVTRPLPGDVMLLRDTDGDGTAETVITAFGGGGKFENLHGIELSPDGAKMYLATPDSLYVSAVGAGGKLGAPVAIATDLPDGGQHGKRTMHFEPGTTNLLLSVGSSCDLCIETNPEHATMLRINPAKIPQTKEDRTIVASGLRNTLGFDWYPGAPAELWGFDHGSDHHGNAIPPEELNRLANGKHYGWPFVYSAAPGERTIDPIIEDPPETTKEAFAPSTEPATRTYDAHSAPIDFRFYTGDQFPAEYKNDAFVAMRGSWNRYPAVGYKLVRVIFDDQTRQPTGFEDFVTGWLIEGGTAHFGRLAGLAQLPDGSLLLSDDANGVVYRITYAAP